MKNKIAIITLSAVSTIAIGISVYSTVTLNQKYKELENITKSEEKGIETEPIEMATNNYTKLIEDLNTKIADFETVLNDMKSTITDLTTQINNYKDAINTINYINNIYRNASSAMDFSHSFGVGRFDMCMYFYANDIVPSEDNEYYSYCNFK